MLIGPASRAQFPIVPLEKDGIAGIFAYLKKLDVALGSEVAQIVGRSDHLANMQGIGGTGVVANNLRGSMTLAASSQRGTVLFTNVEPDASYYIYLGLQVTAFASELHVSYSSPTATGFIINLNTPPGEIGSAVINWLLIR